MIKAILLDCGGVMIYPAMGDWLLPPGFEEVLGMDFVKERLCAFRAVRGKYLPLIPDANRLTTDGEECAQFIRYYRAVFEAMDFAISEEGLQRLAHLQTFVDDRYTFFDDALPALKTMKSRYKLGIVSDAPPSTRRIMAAAGVMDYIDGATFSCDIGVLKPDHRIYQSTLDQLGVPPGEAVFVDDFPSKLSGAVEMGIRGIQMCREMPALFDSAPVWDGPVARNFGELWELVTGME